MNPTYSQLTKDFQKRNFAAVYLFYGEEPYYVDELSEYLAENVLNDAEKEFSRSIIYGRDVTAAAVVNLSKQFPMVGDRQLVIVREAQDIDLKKEENLSPLLAYCSRPVPSSILVLGFKYKAPPAKLLKLLTASDRAMVFESKRKNDTALTEWIMAQVNRKGYSLSGKGCSMLTEFLGNDLEKISNELSKLFINHPKSQPITEDVIEKYIGVSKDYNIFELESALANRNALKANIIIDHFAHNPKENHILKITPMLFGFFSKVLLIHSLPDKSEANIVSRAKLSYYGKPSYLAAFRNYTPAKIQDIIGWIRECHTRALGIDNYSTSEGDLMRELIFKILH